MNCVTRGCTRLSIILEELCAFSAQVLLINQCVVQWRMELRDPAGFLCVKVGFSISQSQPNVTFLVVLGGTLCK